MCVASNRPAELADFLRAWEPHWAAPAGGPAPIVFVHEDAPRRSGLPETRLDVRATCHADIEERLGARAWIIPRDSGASRSFAFLAAWDAGCDFVVSLDDDCRPAGDGRDYLRTHFAAFVLDRWFRTTDGEATRGVPYQDRGRLPVLLNHGTWLGAPDVDGPTAVRLLRDPGGIVLRAAREVVPGGMYFALSGMNVCYRREALPAAYNLLMGVDAYGIDRFDDIWSGLFLKRIADHLGLYVTSGLPFVFHARASDPFVNLRKEALGLHVHESLWKAVADAPLDGAATIGDAYLRLADRIESFRVNGSAARLLDGYFARTAQAMRLWVEVLGEGVGREKA